MEYRIFNKIVLYGAEQGEINKVFNFIGDKKKAIDFRKIIPISTEPKITLARSKHEEVWAYYQAKRLGNYEEIDKILEYKKVKDAGIKTRKELLDVLLKNNSIIYEYGKELDRLNRVYGHHDWYIYNFENWDTKWNADDVMRVGNVIGFYTEGIGVTSLMLMVSEKFPDIIINYEFAAENFGCDTARYTLSGGEIIAEYEPINGTCEARQLTNSVFGCGGSSEDIDKNVDYL